MVTWCQTSYPHMTNTPKQNPAAVCELLPFHLFLFDPFLLHVLGFELQSVSADMKGAPRVFLRKHRLHFKRQRVSTN